MKKLTMVLCLLVLFSGSVFAGGFQINEHSARAMGMGGAYTAMVNDASAVYWNGAALTQLWGTQFVFGTTLIQPSASFRGVAPEVTEYKLEKQLFYPVHFFGSHRLNDDWAIGIGFTTPFGLGTKWDPDWVGKYLAIETSLMTFVVTPTVAYKISDELSLSAGFVYSFANVDITQKNSQAPFEGDATIELSGDDNSAFGYNFGLMYKPMDEFSIGVSFHSEINYDFKGTADTKGAQQLLDAKILPTGDVTAELTTPMNIALGLAYSVTPCLTLSADFQYIGWSSYDTLKVDFTDPAYSDLASPREYKDSYIIRLGGAYEINSDLSVLAGIYYDNNPVEPEYLNPSLPDANRLGLSAGIDYKLTSCLGISASYLYIRGSELTVEDSKEDYTGGNAPFNGTYNTSANLFSLSFSYSL